MIMATAADRAVVVQDVFLQAMKQLPALRKREAFGAWLAAMTRNAIRDRYRVDRWRTIEGLDVPAATSLHVEIEARAALAAIAHLPAAYRDTLRMRLVDGMTGPEIAKATGLTHASVRVNLHRGLALLRQRLAPEHRQSA